MIVRLLIWSLFDSQTTIDALREALPALDEPSMWLWSEPADRFGALVLGDELPEAVGWARDRIGDDPDVYEEFDALELRAALVARPSASCQASSSSRSSTPRPRSGARTSSRTGMP